jgi:hypothetical protein
MNGLKKYQYYFIVIAVLRISKLVDLFDENGIISLLSIAEKLLGTLYADYLLNL